MTELDRCPFCGGNDLSVEPDFAEDDNNRIYAYHVFCRDCHARGRNNYPIGWVESKDEAIHAWNNRAPVMPLTPSAECIVVMNKLQMAFDKKAYNAKELIREQMREIYSNMQVDDT